MTHKEDGKATLEIKDIKKERKRHTLANNIAGIIQENVRHTLANNIASIIQENVRHTCATNLASTLRSKYTTKTDKSGKILQVYTLEKAVGCFGNRCFGNPWQLATTRYRNKDAQKVSFTEHQYDWKGHSVTVKFDLSKTITQEMISGIKDCVDKQLTNGRGR